jgi:hypothetical protein
MPLPRSPQRFRCRFCGVVFSAWLAVPGEPDGALLLHHVTQAHPAEVGRFLDQMHTDDDITPAIVQAYEVVEAPSTPRRASGLQGHDATARNSTGRTAHGRSLDQGVSPVGARRDRAL